MITLRLTHLPVVAECETVDDAVEFVRRVREIPRTIEVFRARSGRVALTQVTGNTSAVGSAKSDSSEGAKSEPATLTEAIEQFRREAPNAFADIDAVLEDIAIGRGREGHEPAPETTFLEQIDRDAAELNLGIRDFGGLAAVVGEDDDPETTRSERTVSDTVPAPPPSELGTEAGELGRGQSEPHPATVQQGVATPGNSQERPAGNVAKPHGDPKQADRVAAPASVEPARPKRGTPEWREACREGARKRWAKVRAEKGEPAPAPTVPKRTRTVAAVDELPPVQRGPNGQPRGCGVAILTAFSRDPGFPLGKLAKHVYGSSNPGNVAKLRALISREFLGKLEPCGPDAWRVTQRGEEALRAATRPHEQTGEESLAIARATAGGRSAAE